MHSQLTILCMHSIIYPSTNGRQQKTPGREITKTDRGRHKKGDRTFIPTAIIPQAAGEVKTQDERKGVKNKF